MHGKERPQAAAMHPPDKKKLGERKKEKGTEMSVEGDDRSIEASQ